MQYQFAQELKPLHRRPLVSLDTEHQQVVMEHQQEAMGRQQEAMAGKKTEQ
jgi:hypothetical protein